MFNKYKKGSKIFVYGYGKTNGKFYKNISGEIIECDPYFKDYRIKFKDGTEDWILPQYLRRPYERNKK